MFQRFQSSPLSGAQLGKLAVLWTIEPLTGDTLYLFFVVLKFSSNIMLESVGVGMEFVPVFELAEGEKSDLYLLSEV